MPTLIVEVDEGRTVEQKRGLVKDITEAVCKNCIVEPQTVTIFIHEGKKENRGKAGKLAIDLYSHAFFISISEVPVGHSFCMDGIPSYKTDLCFPGVHFVGARFIIESVSCGKPYPLND